MYEMYANLDRGLIKVRNKLKPLVIDYIIAKSTWTNLTTKREKIILNSLNCFITNSFRDYCKGYSRTLITLDHHNFSNCVVNGVKLKSVISFAYTKLIFSCLEDNGYVVLNKGGRSYDWVKGKVVPVETACSYIEFGLKLTQLYNNYKHVYSEGIIRNIIELRDEDKRPKTFKSTRDIMVVKDNLIAYNTLSLTNLVRIPKGKSYDYQLRKIYNGTFARGGRLQMSGDSIQSLTKEERMELSIKGNETVIYDFKSFEPSIAYSINQEIMKGDPYQLDWVDYDRDTLRSLGKLALTTMLYAEDKGTAIAAINYNIGSKFNVDNLYNEGLIPSPCIPAKRLVEALEKKNNKILNLMYNNTEYNLSNVGSLIMDFIVNYWTQRHICVLPIYDEIIIEAEHDGKIVEVMEMAYESVLGFTDNCYIVKEK